jgi:hypothetical protein
MHANYLKPLVVLLQICQKLVVMLIGRATCHIWPRLARVRLILFCDVIELGLKALKGVPLCLANIFSNSKII